MSTYEQESLGFTEAKKNTGPVECLGRTFESDEARREHYLALLAEKLKDPEFRSTPGFPKGTDEAILRLSDPPYYTACPNPFLEEFVRVHGRPYDPNEPYHREPYASDLFGGKNDKFYNAHGYHTKVPPGAIEKLLAHFTDPGDVVYDCFSGSGMMGVAAAKLGRNAVLADLSPAATAIADGFVHNDGSITSSAEATALLDRLETQHGWMFRTRHVGWPASIRTGPERRNSSTTPNHWGSVLFTVWSDVFLCPECQAEVVYWDAAVCFETGTSLDPIECPTCTAKVTKRTMSRCFETMFDPSLGVPRKKAKRKPVLINYTYQGKRYEKEPDADDFGVLGKVRALQHVPYPSTLMMGRDGRWGDQWRSGYHSDVSHAHDFLFERSAIVLTHAWETCIENRDLRFWFTSTLPWCTRENRLHLGNYFGKKGGVITSMRGTLYWASLMVETNPIERLRLRTRSSVVPKLPGSSGVFISTQSATLNRYLPDRSIDYCFIDPPFGFNLMYSELNFQWESWLRVFTEQTSEAIISKTQMKALPEYAELMRQAFSEVKRVLKPGRWVTVEFHNSSNAVWIAIQETLQSAGLVVADVRVLDKGKGSFNAVVAGGAVKKDLMISAYRPSKGLEQEFALRAGTLDGVWAFVRAHLEQLPVVVQATADGAIDVVAERLPHLLYDRMIAFHVQRGTTVPISASDFYIDIERKFPQRDGMTFLEHQVSEYDRKRTTVNELRQLTLFVSDEASATRWIRQQLQTKPQSFQDLQPQFMQQLQSWEKHEKTIELKEILELNFFCYEGTGLVPSQIHSYLSTNFKDLRNLDKEDGRLKAKATDRWYVPDPKKEGDLEKLRLRTLFKEFEEYQSSTSRKIKQFRTEAVRAGFKHCYDQGDYQTIVAVAGKLPEKVIQEDEKLLMYYDVATMRLDD